MAEVLVPAGAKSISIEAVKIRTDGTKEDLGVLFYWHRNPFINLWWQLKFAVRRLFKGA